MHNCDNTPIRLPLHFNFFVYSNTLAGWGTFKGASRDENLKINFMWLKVERVT
jgi:hypothetical protein